MKSDPVFILRTKNETQNSCLCLYGGYLKDEAVRTAILNAGWEPETFPFPPLPEDYIDDSCLCETFFQPVGSDEFGGSTIKEWKENISKLRKALKPFGIKLGRSVKFSLRELL